MLYAMKRPTLLTAAVWLALAGHARAETSADTATREFERIQVTATRSERAVADVPTTVSVIDREELDDRLVRRARMSQDERWLTFSRKNRELAAVERLESVLMRPTDFSPLQ